MHVTLACGTDELTIWFARPAIPPRETAVDQLPNVRLLFDRAELKAIRMLGLRTVCPYELAKVTCAHAGTEVQAELPSSYDSSCDMGYIHLDMRGPASVDYTIATPGGVCIDIGKDGAILGFEVFSPSSVLPELCKCNLGLY
jgi:uncharacterized protein YuzE